jgi:ABC-type enterobactin transport system permease subunit
MLNSAAVDSINFVHRNSLSTAKTDNVPLEQNSYAILPVPENKSSTDKSLKSYRCIKILNNASLAISVVGRTGKFFGALSRRPLYVPDIIRIKNYLKA